MQNFLNLNCWQCILYFVSWIIYNVFWQHTLLAYVYVYIYSYVLCILEIRYCITITYMFKFTLGNMRLTSYTLQVVMSNSSELVQGDMLFGVILVINGVTYLHVIDILNLVNF